MRAEQLDLFEQLKALMPPPLIENYDYGANPQFYPFHQVDKVRGLLREIFDITPRYMLMGGGADKDFVGKIFCIALKRQLIDIYAFDDMLHERHGNYEEAGKCMRDVILEHYGKKGLDLIMALSNYTPAEGEIPHFPEVRIGGGCGNGHSKQTNSKKRMR